MKTIKAILLCLLLISAACGDKPAPQPAIPPDVTPQATPAISRPVSTLDVVKASVAASEIAAGRSGEATVLISISHGYHVNANPATFPYLIATAIEAGKSEGITVGPPVYPPAIVKKFSFEPQPLSVYEGDVTIKLPLRAAGNAAKGERPIFLMGQVQACDDSVCYAPATLNLTLHLTVK